MPRQRVTGTTRKGAIVHRPPLLVAIVGGSGAGKSWVADQLKDRLGSLAARLSLDDFYRDRSHLPFARRAQINYDHPRAIDWVAAERVLRDCLSGRVARVPRYNFARHARVRANRILRPKPVILVDGLWWLRRPSLRRLFALRIFLDCNRRLRLSRRMARDQCVRGRNKGSIHRQFRETVEPMNRRFVEPQARLAHIRLRSPVSDLQVSQLAERITKLLLAAEVPSANAQRVHLSQIR
ncbi:MAG TPA: uridine kinase [Verrucomicrobiae bacterium]|jgi:uridine kinase|nr:uridine kinase [Verrucomicrobiae bacterium]